MLKILMIGCNGKMGQVISKIVSETTDSQIVAGVDPTSSTTNNYITYANIFDVTEKADVAIDFSHPSAFSNSLEYCKKTNTPLVMATTGLSKEQRQQIIDESKNIPLFFSANMSIGVNLLINLSKIASQFLEDSFDIEIIEKHHNQKIDSPSGTALAIADDINSVLKNKKDYVYDRQSVRKKREQKEIGIHSIRGGSIVGEHSVIFAGHNEIIELKHEATNKDIFAKGAIKAAQYMNGKPNGLYSMDEMINEIL